jgi:catechol 2,3-dioxygenase
MHDRAAPSTSAAAYGVPPTGFRLPERTRLGRVRLAVSDLARSLAYYEHVLGLRVLDRTGGRATLGAHGDDTPLLELVEQPGVRPVPRTGRLGLYHFAILLPDRAALGRFIAHLARLDVRAGMANHLVSESVYLSDPDGLGIEVYADRPRTEWQANGREVAMATEPLDVRSVVQAANGEAWEGMSAGTTIGHVHLHVGDLDVGRAFYHQALGLDLTVWSYPGALFLAAGGYHHHLGTNTWARGAPGAGDGDARLLEWELVLPSADAVNGALESLERAGAVVHRASDGGVVRDPWGTALRIRFVPAAGFRGAGGIAAPGS